MRILHIVTLFERGGAQSVVLELARSQIADGHLVAVMSSVDGGAWDELDSDALQIPCRYFLRKVSFVEDVLAAKAIAAAVRRFKPDIVHLHSSKAGTLGRLALPGMRGRIVYTVHGFDSLRIAFRKYLPLERMLRHVSPDGIVAVSKYDADNLAAEGIPGAHVIHNGIRDFIADPPHGDQSTVALFAEDRAHGKITVCTIARLALPKRFDLFVAAAEGCPDMHFFWIGNRTAPQSGLPVNLTCLGDVPDARALLRETDIFCLLSDYEGLPMSVIEALCAGKPVVASDVGGVREALSGNETGQAGSGMPDLAGILVANEEEAVVNTLRVLGSDAAKRKTLSCIARARYTESFSAVRMHSEYLKIYERLLADSGNPNGKKKRESQ
ncbi:MAG: glycosyltransferase [Rectinemataceae bacterium]